MGEVGFGAGAVPSECPTCEGVGLVEKVGPAGVPHTPSLPDVRRKRPPPQPQQGIRPSVNVYRDRPDVLPAFEELRERDRERFHSGEYTAMVGLEGPDGRVCCGCHWCAPDDMGKRRHRAMLEEFEREEQDAHPHLYRELPWYVRDDEGEAA